MTAPTSPTPGTTIPPRRTPYPPATPTPPPTPVAPPPSPTPTPTSGSEVNKAPNAGQAASDALIKALLGDPAANISNIQSEQGLLDTLFGQQSTGLGLSQSLQQNSLDTSLAQNALQQSSLARQGPLENLLYGLTQQQQGIAGQQLAQNVGSQEAALNSQQATGPAGGIFVAPNIGSQQPSSGWRGGPDQPPSSSSPVSLSPVQQVQAYAQQQGQLQDISRQQSAATHKESQASLADSQKNLNIVASALGFQSSMLPKEFANAWDQLDTQKQQQLASLAAQLVQQQSLQKNLPTLETLLTGLSPGMTP